MQAALCPRCGSGKIARENELILSDEKATCTGCGWAGKTTELVIASLELSSSEVVLAVAQTYLAKIVELAAKPIGTAMVSSGLVAPKDASVLGRLIRAACLSAHRATLEEIEKIQREKADGGPGN
jgi:hypothetical protein